MGPIATRFSPSSKALRLRDRLLARPLEVDMERAHHYTAAWRESEGVAPCVRTARALQRTLRSVSIRIDGDDLLAGVRTAKATGAIVPAERNPELVIFGAGALGGKRLVNIRAEFTNEEKAQIGEVIGYWQGKTARNLKEDLWKEEGLYDAEANSLLPYELGIAALDTQGHTIPGYRRVLKLGFKGIAEWAERRLAELKEDDEDYDQKKDFLESVPIVAAAVCEFAERYAGLATEMAAAAEGQREKELLEIAERCRRVPANPPRTFMEAAQALWLSHVALCISYGVGDVFSTGRIDQYLYPYYKADLETGCITPDSARLVIEELHLKLATGALPATYTITIGGVDENGEDATNDLSYMFLSALENLGALRNNVSVRISPKTPREFTRRAWELHRKTAGVAFYNDEIVIRDLLEDGYALEDARDYSIVGCVEPTTTGKDFSYTAGNAISIVRALELALNEGRFLLTGRQVGAPTPPVSSFATFDDIRKAYAAQIAYCVEMCVKALDLKDKAYAMRFPSPLLSSTLEGCLESGHDCTRGGARYNYGHIGTQGLATVVNSLAAIRWAVFEHKLLTMDELVGHLRANFEGADNLRQELMHKAPKYGNDDPKTDAIAEWVVGVFCDEIRKHRCARGGGIYRPLILSSGFQVAEGWGCQATPDGRLAHEPVTDGISPAHGTEENGLTAVMHSAAKAGRAYVSDGTTLTLSMSPGLLATDEGVEKLCALLDGYFRLGGRHVQFTPVDRETLLDAQEHPEKYPTLAVKVSGYSAIFVDLPKSLQDDIIARTAFADV